MTDEQTKPKWGGAYGLPSGHRLFYDTAAGATRVAIADDSANQPQDTDDGILWLDQVLQRPLGGTHGGLR
jgi:hypothetical protein